MPQYTSEIIRTMNGPELTGTAYALGLAPAGVLWSDDWYPLVTQPCYEDPHGVLCPTSRPWHPHEDLAQAEAIFRTLRTRGWSTGIRWYAYKEMARGEVYADKTGAPLSFHEYFSTETEECLALLRISILAMVSEAVVAIREA